MRAGRVLDQTCTATQPRSSIKDIQGVIPYFLTLQAITASLYQELLHFSVAMASMLQEFRRFYPV